MVRVGQKVRFVPAHNDKKCYHYNSVNIENERVDGIVTYVHKRHKWYMVEAFMPCGVRIRECFKMARAYEG